MKVFIAFMHGICEVNYRVMVRLARLLAFYVLINRHKLIDYLLGARVISPIKK